MNEDVRRVLEILAAEFGMKSQENIGDNVVLLVIEAEPKPDEPVKDRKVRPFRGDDPPDMSATYD